MSITQTKQIWMELGVPADSFFELPGQNTSSEMASLKEPVFVRRGLPQIIDPAIAQ